MSVPSFSRWLFLAQLGFFFGRTENKIRVISVLHVEIVDI